MPHNLDLFFLWKLSSSFLKVQKEFCKHLKLFSQAFKKTPQPFFNLIRAASEECWACAIFCRLLHSSLSLSRSLASTDCSSGTSTPLPLSPTVTLDKDQQWSLGTTEYHCVPLSATGHHRAPLAIFPAVSLDSAIVCHSLPFSAIFCHWALDVTAIKWTGIVGP